CACARLFVTYVTYPDPLCQTKQQKYRLTGGCCFFTRTEIKSSLFFYIVWSVFFLLAASDRVVAALTSRSDHCAAFLVIVSQSFFAVFSVKDARSDAKPNALFPGSGSTRMFPMLLSKCRLRKACRAPLSGIDHFSSAVRRITNNAFGRLTNSGARVPQLKSWILPCSVKA
ncbi:unnamed protein product, partial [Ectocarpus sp. 13 AM-2016]